MFVTQAVRKRVASVAVPAVAGLVLAGLGPALPSQAAARTVASVAGPGLHVAGKVRLAPASTLFSDVFAEAPNGGVYYSVGKHVYVVNGDSAAALAVTAGNTVVALAANSTDFFVQTGLTVRAYTRKHDTFVRTWTLTSPVRPITSAGLLAAGSTVWSWTDWATDPSGFEFATVSRFSAGSAKVVQVSKSNAYAGDMTADQAGLYYEIVRGNAGNGYLVRAAPAGQDRRGFDANLNAPLALAAGRADLLSVHGNGHTYIDSFRATTLTRVSSRRVSGADRNIAGTSAGLLVVQEPCPGVTCYNASVSVLSPATGGQTRTLRVPHAFVLLLSPSAAVITDVGGWLYLVRLAG